MCKVKMYSWRNKRINIEPDATNVTATELPPRIKQDIQDMKPLRKLLKGNVPTRQQYTNWITPVKNTYSK